MGKKGISNYSNIETNIKNMDNTLNKLSENLVKLKTLITRMMTEGEGGGKLWTGTNAEIFYDKAVRNLNNNLNDYHAAYKRLVIFNKYYNKVKDASSSNSSSNSTKGSVQVHYGTDSDGWQSNFDFV